MSGTHRTKTIHPARQFPESGNHSLVTPIFQSVKYVPKNYQHLKQILSDRRKGYLYSRVANPTVRELEVLLSTLQGQDDCICVGTGIAALATTMLALCQQGSHVLMFRESYKPTRFLQLNILSKMGIRTTVLGIDQKAEVQDLFTVDPPHFVIVESPTNPTLRLMDLKWLSSLCKPSKTLLILDNTFAGFDHHGDLPIDVYCHSLTKHASGHSDAMGGAIIANRTLIEKIAPVAITLGASLDPNSAWLILRGLKTYALRTNAASRNAHEIADYFRDNPQVQNLQYPALSSHPDFELCMSQMQGDGGTVLTFDLKIPSQRNAEDVLEIFIDSLQLFSLTPSMGCVESLVAPCLCLFADDFTLEDAKRAGISISTVRLAVGIENPRDLILDIEQALAKCR